MEPSSCQKGSFMDYVRKTTPPPFLLKTYMLVEDPETDEVISWNPDGTAFVVWQPDEFSRDILPTLFKHSNFSSFVRQLNTYGFHKVVTCRWEFCNGMFRRGARELLCEIRRRKAWANNNKRQQQRRKKPPLQQLDPQSEDDQRSSSSTSSSSEYGNLVHENKRLKRENGDLNAELTIMKRKCKDLTELVAKFTHRNKDDMINYEEKEEEENKGPKLFGVRLLGVHGKRSYSSSSSLFTNHAGITRIESSMKTYINTKNNNNIGNNYGEDMKLEKEKEKSS